MTTYKTLPYVYICTNRETGQFYIGYREGNKTPSYQDLPLYKTSSKQVNPVFDQYSWEIIAEFFDGTDAYNFEQSLIHEHWEDPLLINKSCFHQKRQFRCVGGMLNKHHSDETKAKMSEKATGNTRRSGKQHSDETKAKMSKAQSGKILSDEHKLKLSAIGKTKTHSDETKNKMKESKKYSRICRLRDHKEMDIANFYRYP